MAKEFTFSLPSEQTLWLKRFLPVYATLCSLEDMKDIHVTDKLSSEKFPVSKWSHPRQHNVTTELAVHKDSCSAFFLETRELCLKF